MNETMAREIRAQAEILPRLLDPLSKAAERLPVPRGRIFAGGCGDCAFAPAALAQVISSLPLEIVPRTAMELASYTRLRPGDTVLLGSISGTTRQTLEAARAARAAGARVVAITCGAESALALAADDLVHLPYEPISRKTPHTLDYLVTLEALAVVALQWAGQEPRALDWALQSLPTALARAEGIAARLLEVFSPDGRLFIIGGGSDLATAAYGAAKFHEAGGLAAMAAETENFIHGMNFMLEPTDLLVAVATEGASLSRGQRIVEAYRELPGATALLTSSAIPGSDPCDRFAALLDVTVALQMFCLRVAMHMGLDVEAPRAGRSNGEAHLRVQSRLMAMLAPAL